MLRTFIAVNPPQDIRRKISRISKYFRTQTPDEALRWSGNEHYHLTLKFLGDIQQENLPQIQTLLAEAVKTQPAFDLTLEGLGFFPNEKTPRAILLHIQDGRPLAALHQRMDFELESVGVPRDKRPFTPHLTIARIRRRTEPAVSAEIGKTLSQFKVDPLGSFRIDTIHLYQSELTPKGSVYTSLFSSPLRAV